MAIPVPVHEYCNIAIPVLTIPVHVYTRVAYAIQYRYCNISIFLNIAIACYCTMYRTGYLNIYLAIGHWAFGISMDLAFPAPIFQSRTCRHCFHSAN